MFADAKKAAVVLTLAALFLLVVAGCGNRHRPLVPVVIVGLDGASWNVLQPLLDAGRMPNLQRLIDQGAYGPIESCCHTVSPAVWTTIVTGRDSTEHGIYDFTMTDPRTGDMTKVNNSHRQKKALWEILTDKGLRTGLVNLFSTYPFDRFNGFGYLIERGESYPDDLLPAAEKIKLLQPDPAVTFRVGTKLLAQPWDLFLVYDRKIDATQHLAWKYYEPERFNRVKWLIDDAGIRAHANDIPAAYEQVDRALGGFLAKLPPEAAVIVVSDHGGKANHDTSSWYMLATNRLLADVGLMKLDPGFLPVPGQSPLYVMQGGKPALGTLWDRTDIYAVNVDGARQALGLAAEVPEEAVYAGVAARLRSLKVGGKANLPIFDDVSVQLRPSPTPPAPGQQPVEIRMIVARENNVLDKIEHDMTTLPVGPNGQGKPLAGFVIQTPSSGVHAEQGVIILSGPMFKNNFSLDGATVYDVTPTVLALLGVRPAKDMRGNVLDAAFTADFAERVPQDRVDTYEDGSRAEAVRLEPLLDTDRKQLRSLGYL